MGNKKVTVIIGVFNVESLLQRCVDSIIDQDYNNLEIILVDDGSVDSSSHICDEYAAKDNRVVVIHKKNEGISVARNVALSVASGEFVSFIDSDDQLRRDAYGLLIGIMENNDVDLIKYDHCIEESKLRTNPEASVTIVDAKEINKKVLCDEYGSQLWQYFFKRSLWDGVESPAGRLAQDMMTLHIAVGKAERCAEFNDTLYYYYQANPNNVSNGNHKSIRGTADRAYAFWLRVDYCKGKSEYKAEKKVCFKKAVEYSISCFLRKEFLQDDRYKADSILFSKRIRRSIARVLFASGVSFGKRIGAIAVFFNKRLLSCIAKKR